MALIDAGASPALPDQLPQKILHLQAAAQGGALRKQEHGDGMALSVVGHQAGVVAVDGLDRVKNGVQKHPSFLLLPFIKVRFIGLFFLYTEVTQIRKEQNAMDYELVWVRGHIEVYDWAGRFCFSADNEREAREELGLTA